MAGSDFKEASAGGVSVQAPPPHESTLFTDLGFDQDASTALGYLARARKDFGLDCPIFSDTTAPTSLQFNKWGEDSPLFIMGSYRFDYMGKIEIRAYGDGTVGVAINDEVYLNEGGAVKAVPRIAFEGKYAPDFQIQYIYKDQAEITTTTQDDAIVQTRRVILDALAIKPAFAEAYAAHVRLPYEAPAQALVQENHI